MTEATDDMDGESRSPFEEAPAPVVSTAKPVRRTKGFLKATMSRHTSESAAAFRPLPKRRVTFTVSAVDCLPGVFEEDFELTLQSLDSATELMAANRSKGDPTALAFWMARFSLHSVNGDPINEAEAEGDWIWEALGPSRQLVMGIFARTCMPDAASQGKALSGLRVE